MTTEAADTTTIGGGWLARFELGPGEQIAASFPAVCYGGWTMTHEGRAFVTGQRIVWLRYRWLPFGKNSVLVPYERIRRCELLPSTWFFDEVVITLRNLEKVRLTAARSVWVLPTHVWPLGKLFGDSIVSAELYDVIETARARFNAASEAGAS